MVIAEEGVWGEDEERRVVRDDGDGGIGAGMASVLKYVYLSIL